MPYKRHRKQYSKDLAKGNKSIKEVLEIAQKGLSLALTLKRMINVEYKFLDQSVTSTAISDTGTITQLTNVAQGLTSATRSGDSIKLVSLQFK